MLDNLVGRMVKFGFKTDEKGRYLARDWAGYTGVIEKQSEKKKACLVRVTGLPANARRSNSHMGAIEECAYWKLAGSDLPDAGEYANVTRKPKSAMTEEQIANWG